MKSGVSDDDIEEGVCMSKFAGEDILLGKGVECDEGIHLALISFTDGKAVHP